MTNYSNYTRIRYNSLQELKTLTNEFDPNDFSKIPYLNTPLMKEIIIHKHGTVMKVDKKLLDSERKRSFLINNFISNLDKNDPQKPLLQRLKNYIDDLIAITVLSNLNQIGTTTQVESTDKHRYWQREITKFNKNKQNSKTFNLSDGVTKNELLQIYNYEFRKLKTKEKTSELNEIEITNKKMLKEKILRLENESLNYTDHTRENKKSPKELKNKRNIEKVSVKSKPIQKESIPKPIDNGFCQ